MKGSVYTQINHFFKIPREQLVDDEENPELKLKVQAFNRFLSNCTKVHGAYKVKERKGSKTSMTSVDQKVVDYQRQSSGPRRLSSTARRTIAVTTPKANSPSARRRASTSGGSDSTPISGSSRGTTPTRNTAGPRVATGATKPSPRVATGATKPSPRVAGVKASTAQPSLGAGRKNPPKVISVRNSSNATLRKNQTNLQSSSGSDSDS